MNIKELLAKREDELTTARAAYDAVITRQKGITTQVREEGRKELTQLERTEFEGLESEKSTRADAVKRAEANVTELRTAVAEEDKAEREAGETKSTGAGEQRGAEGAEQRSHAPARVVSEERTYTSEKDRRGALFLRDLSSMVLDPTNFEARDRLARHMQEEKVERGAQLTRAVGTGAFAGLTVPQYLTDLYAPAVSTLSPFFDACNKHTLPEQGMSLNISRITTSTSAALQSSENAAVSETNLDDTLLTVPVQTAAGQQTISRQAIDRGAGVEEVVLQDLFKRYAVVKDSTVLNQATTGLSAVATSVAYTDASPTAAELYPKILNAAANSEAALLGMAETDLAVMHSRRWYWLQSQMTSTWPAFGQPGIGAQQVGMNLGEKYGAGFRGVLPNGLSVVVDNNIATNLGAGTNEDELYVVPSSECHVWEDSSAPLFIRAEQPAAASLGVLLVVYGYFAYTFGRYPSGFQKIAGTGNVTPAFGA